MASVELPSQVAEETARVDGCVTVEGVTVEGNSRCWTSEKSPAEVAATLKDDSSGLDIASVTERRGIPGSGGDFTLTLIADNGQKVALSIIGRNVRDQSLGEGPTLWKGSVIQALPTSA